MQKGHFTSDTEADRSKTLPLSQLPDIISSYSEATRGFSPRLVSDLAFLKHLPDLSVDARLDLLADFTSLSRCCCCSCCCCCCCCWRSCVEWMCKLSHSSPLSSGMSSRILSSFMCKGEVTGSHPDAWQGAL